MGWDGSSDWTTQKKAIDATRADFAGRVLAENTTHEAWYAAIRSYKNPALVIGLVVLTEASGRGYMVKLMDEFSGPYFYGASRAVLDALTPLDAAELHHETPAGMIENARKWRAATREHLRPEPTITPAALRAAFR
jgi:hypothetical protein